MRPYASALAAALACALATTAAGLTVASITPNPAPIGESVTLTFNMEGVTEADLEGNGGQNALRVSWPTSERGSQVAALSGWPSAGSAPADGKVACTLTRSTANRWPEEGPIQMGTIRAAWLISPSLGWITIQNAGCADLGGGVDACSIEFDENAAAAANTTQNANEATSVWSQTGRQGDLASILLGLPSLATPSMLKLGLQSGSSVTLYKIEGDECGQSIIDSEYASYAKEFSGLLEGALRRPWYSGRAFVYCTTDFSCLPSPLQVHVPPMVLLTPPAGKC